MSTQLFDRDIMARMYVEYAAIRSKLPIGAPGLEQMADALYAGYLANRAAFAATYPHQAGMLGQTENLYPVFEQTAPARRADLAMMRTWVLTVRSLEYNTISNGGACYWPEQRRDIVFYAERLVLDKLAGITD